MSKQDYSKTKDALLSAFWNLDSRLGSASDSDASFVVLAMQGIFEVLAPRQDFNGNYVFPDD